MKVSAATDEARSAYGLNFAGLGAPPDMLGDPLAGAPTVSCTWHLDPAWQQPDDISTHITDREAVIDHPAGVRIRLDRARQTATFTGHAVAPDMRAHPLLSPIAMVFSRWLGLEVFHGGVVIIDGLAWVISGPREAGKSTLVADLASRGHAVLTDDVAVTDGTVVHRGPRCVDLREVPPIALSGSLEIARGASRQRLTLGSAPVRAELGGWVRLRWASQPSAEVARGGDALRLLAARRWLPELESDERQLLDAAQRPMIVLARPRDWSRFDSSTDLLLDAIRRARFG